MYTILQNTSDFIHILGVTYYEYAFLDVYAFIFIEKKLVYYKEETQESTNLQEKYDNSIQIIIIKI